jgi:hypothetical protein
MENIGKGMGRLLYTLISFILWKIWLLKLECFRALVSPPVGHTFLVCESDLKKSSKSQMG